MLQRMLGHLGRLGVVGVGTAAAELRPVYNCLKAKLRDSPKIVVDETRAPVLDPGRGRTKTGYFWAISRDDRP